MKKLLALFVMYIIFFLSFSICKANVKPDPDSILSLQIEMLRWDEVNKLLPKYSTFKVVDFETGQSFMVQRRAGHYHADVQPISHRDTKIMKDIYNGEWSWRRRAILVAVNDEWIAASMHGMPHGAGALKNGFPGHFCIHFFGSKTHRSHDTDLSHQLMILKAAGKLDQYVSEAEPEEVVDIFFAGLKQHDAKIVESVLIPGQKINWDTVWDEMNTISLRRFSISKDHPSSIYIEVPVEYEWIHRDIGRKVYDNELFLVKLSPIKGWKVDSEWLTDGVY
ncbi:hypothetical protein [Bacillus litorisediminis]|uniref:hypothetical protein n=1 Tax=Bacillus litorisediminis TaxID=2922713 RepID=UPI001FAC0228|nr:hypothetical protein [Bacillus litorisediminis]